MSNKILRFYNYEDEAMLVKAQVMHDNLAADLATFTAFFPWLTAPTVAALQTSIDVAAALPLDTQVLANLKVLTEDVNAQVILGNAALSTLGIYAKLTYPNSDARQRVFGQDQWAAARTDQEKMMNALEHAHSLATQAPYNADLIAKGYTAPQVANLLTIANAIRATNTLQEDAKSLRPVSTQSRIIKYNDVWAQLQTINICSKVAFAGNPAKLEQYMLYPNSAESTTVNILCVKNITADPLPDAVVTLVNTSLAPAVSDGAGNVVFTSVNMPDLLEVHIEHPTQGTADYANLTVILGDSNSFTLQVPSI